MSRSASAPTAALPFIQSDDNGKFFFQPAAVKLLSSIKGPICPVVVAGPYRTGKSTLLNLLLDTNVKSGAGFAVGGTVQAVSRQTHKSMNGPLPMLAGSSHLVLRHPLIARPIVIFVLFVLVCFVL